MKWFKRKRPFLKVTLMYKDKPQGSYVDPKSTFIETDRNEGYLVEIVKMTDSEYNKMEEFHGF